LASIALVAVGVAGRARGEKPQRGDERFLVERTAFMQVPKLDFSGATGWLNSSPIRAEELRGKIVLLDFWTYCCINCHHVLPDLAKLEEKYRNELVVIGVHTPKFFAEQDTENIRSKVHEYQIKHPVVNDRDQVIWNRYGVSSWPTLVLFDVNGQFIGGVSGEGHYATLDKVIEQLVARHRAKGDLNTNPLKFFAESEKPDNTPLSYPGKVLVDEPGKRLFIADTAHNRIVQTDLAGRHAVVMGDGQAGLVDGTYGKARFNRPQGMCVVEDTLYVADTENHAIRAIRLKDKSVETVAGNGQQTHRMKGSGPGKMTALSSPWDVILIPSTRSLAIAMAGIHEIWRYDLDSGIVSSWAGTGAENIEDGPIATALFAQPSGLATDGHHLYVADSEVSALRAISLDKKRHYVSTIVGSGLFVFDDVDGRGPEVRLQHCLGVAFGDGKLYVADTYNNKIKVCDPQTKSVETLVGTKLAGHSDNPPKFYQPGGLSVAEKAHKLYVADTNNSQIRVVDLKDKSVSTLELEGLQPPTPPRRVPTFPKAEERTLPTAQVAPGKTLTIKVTLPLPSDYKLGEDVPMVYLVQTPDNSGILSDSEAAGKKIKPAVNPFQITVDLDKKLDPGASFPLKLSVQTFVCSANSKLCMVKNYVWTVPVEVTEKGDSTLQIAAPKS
jgi:thiol-disulfide isomerase/thioredoxin